MALVSFEQIEKVAQSQAAQINAMNGALGPISGLDGRTTLYDPTWGYFLFGQSLRMTYHDTYTYMDQGEFVISGEFTINAEDATAGTAAVTDDAKFLRCFQKYDSLVAVFQAAGLAAAPEDFNDWGGAADPRCIPLPSPLFAKDGSVIYALPGEINVEPGQWGRFIRYRATLKEAKFPSAKAMVNETFIDGAIITITCPKPILNRTTIPGCAGEVIQVQNYTMTEVEVAGSISGVHPSGRGMTDLARDFASDMSNSTHVNMGVIRIVGTDAVVDMHWPDMALDEGSSVEVNHAEQVVQVALKAKAGRI